MSRRLVLGGALSATVFLLALYLFGILQGQRRFTYVLDDPYIHLTLGRNLVQSGTMGINPGEPAFTSSSPLWSTLMAVPHLFTSDATAFPLALNLLLALGILLTTTRFFPSLGPWGLGGLLLCEILLIPLIPLAFTGMEHLFHLLLVGLLFGVILHLGETTTRKQFTLLALLFIVLPGIRLESLFLLGPLTLLIPGLSLWRRLSLLGLSLVIPLGTGLYYWSIGWLPLPNSILAKTLYAQKASPLWLAPLMVPVRLLKTPHLIVPVVSGACLLFGYRRQPRSAWYILMATTIAATLSHLALAQTGWFYRYEAYLVFGLLLSFTAFFLQHRSKRHLILVLALLILPVLRGLVSHTSVLPAARNIHDQQLALSRLIRGSRVALNDIGATSYYGRAYILDLWGLASMEVLDLRRRHTHGGAAMASLVRARKIGLVAVFPSWFPFLPADWIPLASFTISDNVICGASTVLLLATSRINAEQWAPRVRHFFDTLPERTRTKFIYKSDKNNKTN